VGSVLDPGLDVKNVIRPAQGPKGSGSRGWIGVQIPPYVWTSPTALAFKKADGGLGCEPQHNGSGGKGRHQNPAT